MPAINDLLLRISAFVSLLLLADVYSASAQDTKPSCTDLKDGTFYFYPKNSDDRWKSERKGDRQTEINLSTGDTSVWQVDWKKDCRYSMKYLSGNRKLKPEEAVFVKEHTLIFDVAAAMPDYYSFNEFADKAAGSPLVSDTLWRSEKAHPTNSRLFSLMQPADVRKAHFKDTSAYALLYIYRIKQFVCSGVDHWINCNDMKLCNLGNGAAYILKIWKPGVLKLWGVSMANTKEKNKVASLTQDIQFGHKYYIKCSPILTMGGCLPELSLVEEAKGKAEFETSQ